jgi:hypothetical protein
LFGKLIATLPELPESNEGDMDLYTELIALIDALAQERIENAVCGGIAVALHGYVRFTKDIDLLILPADLPRTLSVAEKRGFTVAAEPMTFSAGTPKETIIHRVTKIDGAEFLSLDLVLVTAILEDVWKEREVYSWQDRVIQAVSANGLARMKRLANRDQDQLDLKKLGFDRDEQPPNA